MKATLKADLKVLLDESLISLKDSIIKSLKASNEELLAKVRCLAKRVDELEKGTNVESVKREVDYQANLQYQRLNCVVSGIPADISDDKLEDETIQLLNKVKSKGIVASDIEACHRLGVKKNTIVKFVNRKDANDCTENRRNLKRIGNRCGYNTDKIFINERFTPFVSKLAFYCHVLKRKGLISGASTFKGVIKIKLQDDLHWHRIGHVSHLSELFPNLCDLIN